MRKVDIEQLIDKAVLGKSISRYLDKDILARTLQVSLDQGVRKQGCLKKGRGIFKEVRHLEQGWLDPNNAWAQSDEAVPNLFTVNEKEYDNNNILFFLLGLLEEYDVGLFILY